MQIKRMSQKILPCLLRFNYWFLSKYYRFRVKWAKKTSITSFIVIFLSSFRLVAYFQKFLVIYFPDKMAMGGLRSLISNLGISMIGASAIISSLVLFSTQVNVQRLPHGMFVRASSDAKLMGSFVLAFILSINIALGSLVYSRDQIGLEAIITFWSLIGIFSLFLYSYRRALFLINPINQITAMYDKVEKEFNCWARRASQFEQWTPSIKKEEQVDSKFGTTHNIKRIIFFKQNSHWTDVAKKALSHSMFLANRAVESGEYEIMMAALNALCWINHAYIIAKGKTFFANEPFFDNPLTTDSLIDESLEYLRKFGKSGIARSDEEQIRQAMGALAALSDIYLKIDYSKDHAAKTHSNLASSYLTNLLEDTSQRNLPDILMHGIRLIGKIGHNSIAIHSVDHISQLSDSITKVACAGMLREKSNPVTLESVNQLSNLTFDLLRSTKSDVHYPIKKVLENIKFISLFALNLPSAGDTPAFVLGPFYSSTSLTSLRTFLTQLANSLITKSAKGNDAAKIIQNIEYWADNLIEVNDQIFDTCVQSNSSFTIHMIQWITGIFEFLVFITNSPSCHPSSRQELRSIAVRMIRKLICFPDDQSIFIQLENAFLTTHLFDVAHVAIRNQCFEEATQIRDLLLSWTVRASKFGDPRGIVRNGLSYCSVLSILLEPNGVDQMEFYIRKNLGNLTANAEEARRTARCLREDADSLPNFSYNIHDHDRICHLVDPSKLEPLLIKWANLIDPTD